MNITEEEIKNRVVMYYKKPRILHRLWVEGSISVSAYCFYEILFTLSHYTSKGPKSIYDGIVKFTPTQLSKYCKRSYNTIQNWIKELVEIGALELLSNNYIKIRNFSELFYETGTTFHENKNQAYVMNQLFDLKTSLNENIFQKNETFSQKNEKYSGDKDFSEAKNNSNTMNPYKYNMSNKTRYLNNDHNLKKKEYEKPPAFKYVNGVRYVGNAPEDEVDLKKVLEDIEKNSA